MPTTAPSSVLFRGGFVADWAVVCRLLDLETRGARFLLLDGGRFKVVPPSVLTDADRAFLKEHRDAARACIAYTADDSHLFSDLSLAQRPAEGKRA
jgi:hypothetical protein